MMLLWYVCIKYNFVCPHIYTIVVSCMVCVLMCVGICVGEYLGKQCLLVL